ncbi:hypothetical protein [Rhodobaculum claviforme]|uniref:Uncharacterized protein n=1 Tax=Rhodobaculum claviforme TaxID=1549854 RepID=A0A934TJY1_9RHOB|nr:hypothetical protein [Rhodobaculum claviforme]MBK5926964.1 hypothetical protein [Rhodobaculum claviforme]
MAARRRGTQPTLVAGLALVSGLALGPVIPQQARAQEGPLSAIDWLSRATEAPLATQPAPDPRAPDQPGQPAPPRQIGDITVTPLDGPTTDALGLLPADRAGLPRALWGMTSAATLAEALSALGPETLPALQGLILTLLVAELDPPRDAEGRGALFEARLDRLMAFGALEPALALVEAAGPATDPALFARWFDMLLLSGDAGPACVQLRADPTLVADPAARVYCAARAGAWEEAEALLSGPEAQEIAPPLRRALARFLDPEAAYDAGRPAPVAQPTPLMWQILDALGEGGTTAQLPLAFAHADLGSSAGWKSRLEAAERLARAGALTPNRLLGLYTQRVPAASGGVWDRVAAVQALDTALVAQAPEAVAAALPRAWSAMAEAELEAPLAALMADRLDGLALDPEAAALAWRMALLGGHPAPAPPPLPGAARRDGFLAAIAEDRLDTATPLPPGAMPAAIAEGLTAAPDADTARLLADSRHGEVLLHGLALLQGSGIEDPRLVAQGLRALRAAGQDRIARRAALQLLLLDRRG